MFSALSKLPKTSLKTIAFTTQLLKGYEQSKTSISSRRQGAQSYTVRLDGKLSEYVDGSLTSKPCKQFSYLLSKPDQEEEDSRKGSSDVTCVFLVSERAHKNF